MSILGPVLFAGLFIVPAWLTSIDSKEVKRIAVIDSTHVFYDAIPETPYIKFDYLKNMSLEEIKKKFSELDYYAVLYITHIVHYSPDGVQLYSEKQPSMNVVMHIANALEKEIERHKLATYDIKNIQKILQAVKTDLHIQTIKWTDAGEEKQSSGLLTSIVSNISGFLIYIFIFMFGAQVMRGVMEEKMNRIVEVIVSSVRPFQLMMGKIIGVALVGLTQFFLWIILTVVLVSAFQSIVKPDIQDVIQQQAPADIMAGDRAESNAEPNPPSVFIDELPLDQQLEGERWQNVKQIISATKSINMGVMIGSFLFFFLAGYLLYASLFAAIGSVIDHNTDTQQFMLPITIPLIIGLMVMLNAIQNPEGQLSIWFSIIPFTSPIVMMARIPYGVPFVQLGVSMLLLIGSFIFTTWLSGRIYRTGILMYGKKVSWRELYKWFKN
jgi:ABC-2 type transport system permease protein